jgi:hypothetical protein
MFAVALTADLPGDLANSALALAQPVNSIEAAAAMALQVVGMI